MGTGESARRMRATWTKELVAHLDKHKRYPSERQQKTAEIVVSFVLDRTGHVLSTGIVKGSGDTAFDAAALAMIRRSDPVPQPPPLVADEGLEFYPAGDFQGQGEELSHRHCEERVDGEPAEPATSEDGRCRHRMRVDTGVRRDDALLSRVTAR